jgi:hypothetical protein
MSEPSSWDLHMKAQAEGGTCPDCGDTFHAPADDREALIEALIGGFGDKQAAVLAESEGGLLSKLLREYQADRILAAGFSRSPAVQVENMEALAVMVCQTGGHIPNRDRSLPGSCDFHRRLAERYVAALRSPVGDTQ